MQSNATTVAHRLKATAMSRSIPAIRRYYQLTAARTTKDAVQEEEDFRVWYQLFDFCNHFSWSLCKADGWLLSSFCPMYVRLSVSLCIVVKRYLLQQKYPKYEQMNMKCP